MSEHSAQVLRLEGPLTMQTVGGHLHEGRTRLAAGDLVVDFSAVTGADSAAVALIFDWLRVAAVSGHSLSVRALPDGLRSLASLYGVDALLPSEA